MTRQSEQLSEEAPANPVATVATRAKEGPVSGGRGAKPFTSAVNVRGNSSENQMDSNRNPTQHPHSSQGHPWSRPGLGYGTRGTAGEIDKRPSLRRLL